MELSGFVALILCNLFTLFVKNDWGLFWEKGKGNLFCLSKDSYCTEGVGLSGLTSLYDSYLVDPASSHMLVSKIKPCMSKYKYLILWNCVWLIKSVIVYLMFPHYMDNRSNSRANTCVKSRLLEGMYLLDKKPTSCLVIHNNLFGAHDLVSGPGHSNFCPISFRW